MNIKLATGNLQIKSPQPHLLQKLSDFSSRANKKRGFIFISKVLGKYTPCLPHQITWAQQQLAAVLLSHIDIETETAVIGFAETATGLGLGVYEQLGLKRGLYLHTSRYHLDQPVLLHFREEHSHAPEQRLYQPRAAHLRERLQNVRRIILIDDEFSTGNTLKNIVAQLRLVLPQVEEFVAGALLNWMPKPLAEVKTIALHHGLFDFVANGFDAARLGRAYNPDIRALDRYLPHNFGRFGLERLQLDMSVYVDARRYVAKRVLVLGTGEFIYPAYKLALYLQQHGAQTWVQATGRSPINIDQIIANRLQFKDNYYENIDNFLYNIESYDVIIICYETPELPANHQLKALLQGYAPEVINIMMQHD